jgi:hypothetical protein
MVMSARVEQPEQPERHEGGERQARVCAACGAEARRASARYCATCGRSLAEDYFPTDSLRASYRFERGQAMRPAESIAETVSGRPRATAPRRRVMTPPRPKVDFVKASNNNGSATTALAFVTYALVPYIGILFCPGALLMGGVGLLRSYRSPQVGGRRTAVLGILLGILVLCVQLLLWWILYKVPEWSGAAGL